MRRTISLIAAVLAWSATTSASAGPKRVRTIAVRGGYVNDLQACVPVAAAPSGSTLLTAECYGGSTWDGGWTGHTAIHFFLTVDAAGRFAGRYEEWFTGTYLGDGSYGGIHTSGRFTVDEQNQFIARATIVSASCGFAGARGSFIADGNSVHGGYVARWLRPAAPPAAPTCIPETPPI